MSTPHTARLQDLDHRHLWHPFTHHKLWFAEEPLVITAADGMYLIDSDGNRYLDGISSLWCNVHGHRVPEIDDAVRRQLDRVAHSTMLGLASEPAILLAERLVKIVPEGLTRVFYSDAGATATEIAFKLAVQYWHNIGYRGKSEFVGFTEAYHGDTTGAMSVGRTEAFHKPYFPLLFKSHFAPTPFPYRAGEMLSLQTDEPGAVMAHCLAKLDEILAENAERIAAVCIEPIVQGAAGMIVHPHGFLRGVRDLCTRHNVLLIADEVAVGFGRTGSMFACEHEDVRPDLLCAAKGITGGYLPLAATFATEKIFEAFIGDPWEGKTFFHGHTYTGNPLACAAALASLDLFERNAIVEKVSLDAEAVSKLLAPLKNLQHVGEIRQRGFMIGIELVADKSTRERFDSRLRIGALVCQRMRKHGIILRPLGDVIVIMPPPAMPIENIATIVSALAMEIEQLKVPV